MHRPLLPTRRQRRNNVNDLQIIKDLTRIYERLAMWAYHAPSQDHAEHWYNAHNSIGQAIEDLNDALALDTEINLTKDHS